MGESSLAITPLTCTREVTVLNPGRDTDNQVSRGYFQSLQTKSDSILKQTTTTSFYIFINSKLKRKETPWLLVRKRTIPTERPPLVGEVVPTFADIGCRMVSATDPHGP
jgi:hypothetical protein